MPRVRLLLSILLTCHGLCSAANCDYSNSCPLSTFQSKVGDKWKCPSSLWSNGNYFASTRLDTLLKPVDTSNLTAQVVVNGDETKIELCNSPIIPNGKGSWPPGSYCIPAPSDRACSNEMRRTSSTISAPGRNFTCSPSLPMSECKEGSFEITACCPKVVTSSSPFLDVPLSKTTFYLLKTNITCPSLYSFINTEESVTLDDATASGDLGDYFATEQDGDLTIHFCRYTPIDCKKREFVAPYEYLVIPQSCGRYEDVYCDQGSGYYPQPANTGESLREFCYPNGTYHSQEICGKACPAIPDVPHGTLSTIETGSTTEVFLACEDGYYGDTSTTCTADGNWTLTLNSASCKFAQCDKRRLPRPSRNRVWVQDNTEHPFYFGHNVTFRCNSTEAPSCMHFLDLADSKQVTCLKNSSWSLIPKCYRLPQNCSNPGNTATAVCGTSQFNYTCHEGLQYTCVDHRTTLEQENLLLTCLATGVWDKDAPTCDIIYCNTPNLDISGGEVTSPQYNSTTLLTATFLVNDTLHYQCLPEYVLTGDSVITCGANGVWNGSVNATCDLIVCRMAPVKIPHGKRIDNIQNKTQYTQGDEVQYQCESDSYELDTDDAIVCNDSGMWEPFLPSCNEVTCERPPMIPHSVADPGPFPLNSTYLYICDAGYILSGTLLITCQLEGGSVDWRGPKPTCDIVYCGSVPAITNGAYLPPVDTGDTQYDYNTQFKYGCDTGYNASIIYSTNCSSDRSWHPPPGCHPVHCLDPGIAFTIIKPTKDLYSFKETVNVRCDDDKQYQIPQDLICSNDGLWQTSSGDHIISCNGSPIVDPTDNRDAAKWTYIGVGLGMFALLVGLLLVYIVKKKRRDNLGGDGIKFVRNPSYTPDQEEMTGFSNMTFDQNDPHSFTTDKKNRLVLHENHGFSVPDSANKITEDGDKEWRETDSSPENNYDTLHNRGKMKKLKSVSEAREGFYNTLHRIKSQPIDLEESGDDIYNIPSNPNRNITSSISITTPRVDNDVSRVDVSRADITDEEDTEEFEIYNVPTIGRNANKVIVQDTQITESNDLYSNRAAAEICGTPIETEFDNIIYDNI